MGLMHKTSTYRIVQAMKATGNKPGVIAQWKAQVEQWVLDNPEAPEAAALRSWLPMWQVRNHYSARELALSGLFLLSCLGWQHDSNI